jgi:TfoX/Sxy family transcriptional regulator of competence genes
MFGGICFLLNDHMVAGASKRGLLLRVGKDNHGACVARPHVRPMEMNGRKMAGYIYVAPEGVKTDAALREWLEIASAHVRSLPPKQARAKPKRRR